MGLQRTVLEVEAQINPPRNPKRTPPKPNPEGSTELASRVAAKPHAIKAQDVAQLLGVTRQHIYKLAAKGLIPPFRVGTAGRLTRRQWLPGSEERCSLVPSASRTRSRLLCSE